MDFKKTDIVSSKTGEVLYSNCSKTFELFNEDGYYFWNKKTQSRQFTGIELPLKTYEEKGIFGDLCRLFLFGNSNMLEVRTRSGIRPFNLDDLAVLLNVSSRQARRRLNSFLDSGVLAKLNTNLRGKVEEWLIVNPLYFVSGRRLSDMLYKLFRKDLDPYLSYTARQKFAERIRGIVDETA